MLFGACPRGRQMMKILEQCCFVVLVDLSKSVKKFHPVAFPFFLFLVWKWSANSSGHQNFNKLWNRQKKIKVIEKNVTDCKNDAACGGPGWRLLTLHAAWFSLYLKQIGGVQWNLKLHLWYEFKTYIRDALWQKMLIYDVITLVTWPMCIL